MYNDDNSNSDAIPFQNTFHVLPFAYKIKYRNSIFQNLAFVINPLYPY